MPNFLCEALERRTLMSLGGVDSTFGVGGAALGSVNNGDVVQAAQAADGSVFLLYHNSDKVQHILATGVNDPNFGVGGTATVPSMYVASGLVVNSDGSVVVTGADYPAFSPMAVKLLANGQIDTTFGNKGVLSTDGIVGSITAGPAVRTTTGDIIMSGSITLGVLRTLVLVRLTATGQLDTSFGSGGVLYSQNAGQLQIPQQLIEQTDGKLLVLFEQANDGAFTAQPAIERLLADGTPDWLFGTSGLVGFDDSGQGAFNSMTLRPDGRIVVTGSYNNGPAVFQYLSNGKLDSTFGTAGIDLALNGTSTSTIFSVATVRADGSLRVVGTQWIGVHENPFTAAFTASGQLQDAYGKGGMLSLPYDSGTDNGESLFNTTAGGEILLSSSSLAGYVLRRLTDEPLGTGAGTVQISGRVYNDANLDGVYDTGDTPMSGTEVYLDLNNNGVYDPGEPITVTAADGSYQLSNAPAGSYSVDVPLAFSGMVTTEPQAGSTRQLVAVAGDSITGQDFGITSQGISLASLGGQLLEATQYSLYGESANSTTLPGFTVTLDLNDNGIADAGEPSVFTNAQGRYQFSDIVPGSYQLIVTSPTGWGGGDNVGSPAIHKITLTAGESDQSDVIILSNQSYIGGTVKDDATGSGYYQSSMIGVTMYLDLNDNGQLDPGEPSTTTGSSGYYSFPSLSPGTYVLRQVVPSGYQEEYPDSDVERMITVAPGGGGGMTLIDTPIAAKGMITGTTFNDANYNATRDPGEGILTNRTVYVDLNDNGIFDPGEPAAVSSPFNGTYQITNLPSGTYTVRQVLPPGFGETAFYLQQQVTISGGVNAGNVDFGSSHAAQLTGVVFNDTNGDGGQQSGEAGLAGRTVYMDQNGNGIYDPGEPTAVTNAQGDFDFRDVPPGSSGYVIREELPGGWHQTYPLSNAAQSITLSAGQVGFISFGTEALVPVAVPAGPYQVNEGSSVTLSGLASYEANGTIASLEWDLNYNGTTFNGSVSGVTPIFSAAALDGPSTRTIALEVTDAFGDTNLAVTTVQILNVAPMAAFSGSTITQGSTGAISFSNQFDPSVADTAAGFTYSYDFNDDGIWDLVTKSPTAVVPASYLTTAGDHTIGGEIEDKDGGYTTYTAVVHVNAAVATPLTGTVIGTSGSYKNDGTTAPKAFDGNLSTFFDGPTASGNWVGLDLGSAKIITSLAYVSRSGWPSRMNGGTFQASNSSTFASGVVNLYTIASNANPSSTAFTTQTITNSSAYRYIRYYGPANSYGDVAEIKFFGKAPTITVDSISGVVTSAPAGTTVYLDANNNAKLDSGELSTTTSSNGAYSFSNVPAGSYVIRQVLPSGYTQTTPVNNSGYAITVTGGSTFASENFTDKAPATLTKFLGTVIGTSGSYGNSGNTIAKAVDGNLTRFFHHFS